MTDIVARLRVWCHRPDHLAITDLLDEAARSITDWRLDADVHRKRAAAAVAEIARLRLTADEREAVNEVVDCLTESGTALANPTTTRNTLAALLARLA
jgi:hypothetical protein